MNRQEKEQVVSQVRDAMNASEATFLINYQGASVTLLQTLRRTLYEKNGKLQVAKARLMKIAAAEIDGAEPFTQDFKEQVGLVFAQDQVSEIAKELVNFEKNNEVLNVVSGFYENQHLSKDQVKFFASLPPREVLIAQVLGMLQAPVSQFVGVLHALIARLLYVLQAIAEKKEA